MPSRRSFLSLLAALAVPWRGRTCLARNAEDRCMLETGHGGEHRAPIRDWPLPLRAYLVWPRA